jgi:hypothetical protein
MDNGVKTTSAELRTTTPLRPANATGNETYRLTDEWDNSLAPKPHFAVPEFTVPAKRQNANYVLGYN